jgi:hypothetical protein
VDDLEEVGSGLSRRSFLSMGGLIGAAALTSGLFPAMAQKNETLSNDRVRGRRKLGSLEVSSVGLGCQDFTGTFYATAPSRPSMIALARNAHEHGVTLFDAAEAYGPLEAERILGEASRQFVTRWSILPSSAGTSIRRRGRTWVA